MYVLWSYYMIHNISNTNISPQLDIPGEQVKRGIICMTCILYMELFEDKREVFVSKFSFSNKNPKSFIKTKPQSGGAYRSNHVAAYFTSFGVKILPRNINRSVT